MFRSLRPRRLVVPCCRNYSASQDQHKFLQEYKIRTLLERPIYYYAQLPLPKFSIQRLYEQSEKLSPEFILENAKDTVEHLLVYNARRLKEFRNLPYLVVLNPSISESYSTYLQTMSLLITASLDPPKTVEENLKFTEKFLDEFIDVHADTLPSLSKGFNEVLHLLSVRQIKEFLDAHLKERISMRLIAHQHIQLTKALDSGSNYVEGGKYNGVIKQLNIPEVIKKNAELVNDICLMKYDQAVSVKIDTNLHPANYWGKDNEVTSQKEDNSNEMLNFPYIEYHLDYILTEIFKNSFRSHIENGIQEPVQVTISTSENPSYLELRIRDRGKGILLKILQHIFDYSFTTFETFEGDSYKTLNVPPGVGANAVAGMGYGLPLLKNYVEIFNDTIAEPKPKTKGLLTIQSYYGWGTDVYLKTVGN